MSNTLSPTEKHADTIAQAISSYLENVRMSRSANTARTYYNALKMFSEILGSKHLPIEKTSPSDLSEDAIAWFASELKGYAPATERLYLTAANGFYEFLAAEKLATPNLPRLKMLIRQRSRRTGQRLPQFPHQQIDNILQYAINLAVIPTEHESDYLRNMRDRAFLLTLADTGLRVHEACRLRRGDLDWNEGRTILIGKGDQEAVVRFSKRSLTALRDYLTARGKLDGASGRPLPSLPLFARHDRGAGKKIKPITTTTGRNIVELRVRESLGTDAVGTITPHSFRHYFVTTVLRGSGGNLKLAQELARHRNIAVTQRYAHLSDDELDRGYWDIFENTLLEPVSSQEKPGVT
jgi:site-specific recombinase XerD